LITEGNAEVNKADNDGRTPLFVAAQRGHAQVVKLLLTVGNAEVNKPKNDGRTPLYAAAELGKTGVVKLLLRGGADKNKAIQGWTPLMIAKHKGHQATVALLQ
jgi:ankyrin repeat protein